VGGDAPDTVSVIAGMNPAAQSFVVPTKNAKDGAPTVLPIPPEIKSLGHPPESTG